MSYSSGLPELVLSAFSRHAARKTTPAGTSPVVTIRHRAISSFLARATIKVLRVPPRASTVRARREGDVVVVARLDRLARSTRDLLEIAEEGGIDLRSLGEPWADTTSPAGKMVLTVFAGMAEFERALIHQRTSSGRVAARTRGVRFGRPPKLTPEQIALGRRLVDEGTSVRDVAKVILKCHPATLYRELGKFGPASTRANALASE